MSAALEPTRVLERVLERLRESGLAGEALRMRLVALVGALLPEGAGVVRGETELDACLDACRRIDWREVSPLWLGALLERATADAQRRDAGMHYTSEANILRVLDPLLLDELRASLEQAGHDREALAAFVERLASVRVLDPACGCGNFLVVAYRALRGLEREARARGGDEGPVRVGLAQCIGIELDPAAAELARVALRLAAWQDSPDASGSARIACGDALALDWAALAAPDRLTHVVGNPPFVGKKEQSRAQKLALQWVLGDRPGRGKLDLAAAWLVKAARLQQHDRALEVGFVVTNSLVQGEQVSILWDELAPLGVHLRFAHRTFQWRSIGSGEATVQCVILGLSATPRGRARLYAYDDPRGEPCMREVEAISPYLVEGPHVLVRARKAPPAGIPPVTYGSFALDGGHYTLSPAEREALLDACPAAAALLRPFVGGEELLHGRARYCLWLIDVEPDALAAMPAVVQRVEQVARWRATRPRATTRALAATPLRFAELRQPRTRYLAIPTLSSEQRAYVPMAFLEPDIIASNQIYASEGATLEHFAVLTSRAHMTWLRGVGGRLESRLRYSASIVHATFPWPTLDEPARARIVEQAQQVLDARARHADATLAELYGERMPSELARAHAALDAEVDAAHGLAPRASDVQRLARLLAAYRSGMASAP